MQESAHRYNIKEVSEANDLNPPNVSTVVNEAIDSHTLDINSNHKINSTGNPNQTISYNNNIASHDDLCVISAEPEIGLTPDNPETTIPVEINDNGDQNPVVEEVTQHAVSHTKRRERNTFTNAQIKSAVIPAQPSFYKQLERYKLKQKNIFQGKHQPEKRTNSSFKHFQNRPRNRQTAKMP